MRKRTPLRRTSNDPMIATWTNVVNPTTYSSHRAHVIFSVTSQTHSVFPVPISIFPFITQDHEPQQRHVSGTSTSHFFRSQ